MKTFLILLLPACLAYACSGGSSRVRPENYFGVLKEEHAGLCTEKTFRDVKFQFRYRPIEEIILDDCGDKRLTDSLYMQLYNNHKDLQYFTLTLSSDRGNDILEYYNGESELVYYQMLDYLENGIQDDIYLVEGKDTLPCLLSHFERGFGLTNQNNVSLAFKNTGPAQSFQTDKVLVYDDKLFSTGTMQFRISKETLNNLPGLAYEK